MWAHVLQNASNSVDWGNIKAHNDAKVLGELPVNGIGAGDGTSAYPQKSESHHVTPRPYFDMHSPFRADSGNKRYVGDNNRWYKIA